jgi:hypothetical protein
VGLKRYAAPTATDCAGLPEIVGPAIGETSAGVGETAAVASPLELLLDPALEPALDPALDPALEPPPQPPSNAPRDATRMTANAVR